MYLLYLMVLIDSHTISKSIDNDEKVDDIFESINDLDRTRNPRLRRERFIHRYRAEYKDDYARQADTKLDELEKATKKTTTERIITDHTRHHKSPKRRVGSFWRKFRGKEKKSKHDDAKERKRRIPKNKEDSSKNLSTKNSNHLSQRNKSRRKNRHHFVLRKSANSFAKRDLRNDGGYSPELPNPDNRLQFGVTTQIVTNKFDNSNSDTSKYDNPNYNTPEYSQLHKGNPMKRIHFFNRTTVNLNRMLTAMTTEITHLKQVYGIHRSMPGLFPVTPAINSPKSNKINTATKPQTETTTSATRENDFPGTAQIEELLNDIKLKAIQMVAEQSPGVSDMITNSVTEATFEADPILTHVDAAISEYNLSKINSIANKHNRRNRVYRDTENSNRINHMFKANTKSHVFIRSLKEETMTMARNVEDMLQRELKNIYNKVKNKVSGDSHKEKSNATTKADANKQQTCKLTPPKNQKTTTASLAPKQPLKDSKTANVTTTTTTAQRHNRGFNKSKETTTSTESTTSKATATYDDYLMLTLYEQMLEKTQENNIQKMLSTAGNDTLFKKRRHHIILSKRNAETLTDINLKEDVENRYDDGDNMPDYDYMDSGTQPAEISENSSDSNLDETTGAMETSSTSTYSEPMKNQNSSESTAKLSPTETVTDSSYEGLSNKISYNDFVNGYKHYLKFQKEESQQNFSNLVKYQAHRHHSVDDIGKFILDKIPQLPINNREKRWKQTFFDDTDIEYQEISTKSDDSWFRKHFYLFIDSGPPKKYHTSQTVPLKSALTEPDLKFMPAVKQLPKEQIFIKIGSDDQDAPRGAKDTSGMNLDDLTKILSSIKLKHNYSGDQKPEPSPNLKQDLAANDMYPQSFMGKLFGYKRRHVTKKQTVGYDPDIQFTENSKGRFRRNSTKEEVGGMMEELVTKGVKREDSILSTLAAIEDVMTQTTSKEPHKKYGYVSIDLVPHQTAVVKLRDNTKKSRIREFFRKFHLKKHKDSDKKHAKRDIDYNFYYTTRRARFNPLQKLKDMFKVKSGEKLEPSPAYNSNVPDYEMMTSHIDSFKPVKYDKPMNLDDMKKQIPNISEPYLDSFTTKSSSTRRTLPVFKLDDSDRNLLNHYHISSKTTPKYATIAPLLTKALPPSGAMSTMLASTRTEKTTTKIVKPKSPTGNVKKVNAKTVKHTTTTTPYTTPNFDKPVNYSQTMTLDDMQHVINKLQWKLAKNSKNYPRFSTPHYKRKLKPQTTFAKFDMTTFDYSYFDKSYNNKHKNPIGELIINTKLTRVAKFPISKFKRHHKTIQDVIQHLGDDYLTFQEEPKVKDSPHMNEHRHKNIALEKKKGKNFGHKLHVDQPKEVRNGKSKYTDYFNDLLMWHNDILKLDKVPNPIWKTILSNAQNENGNAYTTPNMNILMQEVDDMNEKLGDYTLLDTQVTPPSFDKKQKGSAIRSASDIGDKDELVRSFAMNDNAIVKSKDIIIQGEAKYYQYNRPTDRDKSVSRVDAAECNKTRTYTIKQIYKAKKKLKPKLIGNGKGKDKRNSSPSPSHRLTPGKRPFSFSYITSSKEEPAILVDTTLMSYDDAIDSIAMEVKKLSRSSQKSTRKSSCNKGDNKAAYSKTSHNKFYPFLKTNKPPEQYFTTPLPMKAHDFDKFLKEHKMDVESVTSPMLELPQIMNSYNDPTSAHAAVAINTPTTASTAKPKSAPVTSQKLIKLDGAKKHPTPAAKSMNHNNKFVSKPLSLLFNFTHFNREDLFFDDYIRQKRLSELIKSQRAPITKPSTTKTTSELNYYNIFKKKIKMFEKKAPPDEKPTETINPKNKEVEITIINFDDIEKATTTNYKTYGTIALPVMRKEDPTIFSEYTERPETTDSSARTYTIKTPTEEIHNKLLYKAVMKTRTTKEMKDATRNLSDYTGITTPSASTDFIKNIEFDINEHDFVTTEPSNSTFSTASTQLQVLDKIHFPFEIVHHRLHTKPYSIPKRVHISSHHYRYDIVYNEDKKNMKPGSLIGRQVSDRPNLLEAATLMNELRYRKRTQYRSPTSESNTEIIKRIDRTGKRNRHVRNVLKLKATQKHRFFSQQTNKTPTPGGTPTVGTPTPAGTTTARTIAGGSSVKRQSTLQQFVSNHPSSLASSASTENSLRISSEKRAGITASTTASGTEARPGSLVFDLKHLRRSPPVSTKKDEQHHKRIYKLSAMIQEKLKCLMKNMTSKEQEVTKRVPKETKCCNCTCTNTTTTCKTTTIPPCSEVEEQGEEVDGFQISCRPDDQTQTTPCNTTTTTHPTTTTTTTTTTTPAPTTTTTECTTTRHTEPATKHHKCFKLKGHELQDLPSDVLYMEPETYEEQCYYETGPMELPPFKTTTDEPELVTQHYDKKRDVSTLNTYTAKDVAALEVIVDLMKNTLGYEDKDFESIFNNVNLLQTVPTTKSHNESTNSIQVHIAIPFDFQTGKKRSPLDPVRIRKVFSARMSSPVDLEYQVHSYEGTVPPTSVPQNALNLKTTGSNIIMSNNFNKGPMLSDSQKLDQVKQVSAVHGAAPRNGLSPGMYLLVDKPRNGFALKPVNGKINLSDLQTRQAGTTESMAESKLAETRAMETTNIQGLAKVTLSKEFIAAINKHLVDLYENMSINHKDARKTRSLWHHKVKDRQMEGRRERDAEKQITINKRRIDWEAVKKYFGHDRVCNCKCQPYKAMCRACAASDAVIDELIFEFNNLGRYMQDHCTEIQTFFWMNPNAGQKLRDTVNRIDKSLTDYYKRAKGKCQGKTCKTFTTYIDKRQMIKFIEQPNQNAMNNLITELTQLADDLNKTVSLQACFNHKLKEEGDKFLNAVNNYINLKKALDKRSTSIAPEKSLIKNVYSLDNINVNIICKPSTMEMFDAASNVALHNVSSTTSRPITEHMFDYDIDGKHKKRKGLKKLLPRKSKKRKLFTYYIADDSNKPKLNFKRNIDYYIPTPLISDGGGAFWHDYIKGNAYESRLVRESIDRTSPNFEIAVVQKGPDGLEKLQKIPEMRSHSKNVMRTQSPKMFLTVKLSPKKAIRDTDTTIDYLTQNLNQLLKLFGSVKDIEAMNKNSNRSTMFLPPTDGPIIDRSMTTTSKLKKSSKCIKKVSTKIHYKEPVNATTATTADSLNNVETLNNTEPLNNAKLAKTEASTKTTLADNLAIPTNVTSVNNTVSVNNVTPFNSSELLNTTKSSMESISNLPPVTYTPPTLQSTLESMAAKGAHLKTATPSTSPVTKFFIKTISKQKSSTTNITKTTKAKKITKTTKAKKTTTKKSITKSSKDALRAEVKKLTSLTTKLNTNDDEKRLESEITAIKEIFGSQFRKPTTKQDNLYGKLKTATMKFLGNLGKVYTDFDFTTTESYDHTSPYTEYSHNIEKYSNNEAQNDTITDLEEESSQMTQKYSNNEAQNDTITDLEDESSQMTPSPTILIINDYDSELISNEMLSEPNKEVYEKYKSLLMSIIQFETNKLQDEWQKVAYGKQTEKENDVKRSVSSDCGKNCEPPRPPPPKSTTCKTCGSSKKCDECDDIITGTLKALKGLTKCPDLQIPDPDERKKPKPCPGLLTKIAHKLGIKIICDKNKPKPKKPCPHKGENRRLRQGKKKNPKMIGAAEEEACDTRRTSKPSQICDIKATFDHVLDVQKSLNRTAFEHYVKNISCYKFTNVDNNFFIPYQKKSRWNWIRNKRSVKIHFSKMNDDTEFDDDDFDVANFNNDDDAFEKFVKGDDGIYKIIQRKKRTASLRALDLGLRNIPPLHPPENELYAMVGDTVTLDCYPGLQSDNFHNDDQYVWRTDRENMLTQDNVVVSGLNISIRNVEPKNVGSYICSQNNKEKRSIRLNVVEIPAFDVVFVPVYRTAKGCTYDYLKAIQGLGSLMAQKSNCGASCSIRIDEPVCEIDSATNLSLVAATTVISVTPQPIKCSVQCRRDIISSLVMLCASNTPVLSAAEVVISRNGVNETLKPCKEIFKPVVTHTLKRKDGNGHREYHKLISELLPGTVDVVLICPAGYYLMAEDRICGTCPPNTISLAGDNTCTSCPRGTRSPPGAAVCSAFGTQPRRYDWWWYPPCGYLVAFGGVFISCGVCVMLAMLVHLVSRDPAPDEEVSYEEEEVACPRVRATFTTTVTSSAFAHTPRTRPLSPSRVILARFFKPSLTSSRATDSQETKFEMWKERNRPPPLPPIDFDF